MWKQVTTYSLAWRSDKGQGVVRVRCEDDSEGRVEVDSALELEALGSILRNEKPIFFSDNLKALRTGPEPPGEEEAE
jgi:hypothetical protein